MAEEAKIDLSINAGNAPQTLGGLEDKIARINEELKDVEIGSKQYKELTHELRLASREVDNLSAGFKLMNKEEIAGEMGKLAGAVGSVTSAVVLLGGENEELEAMIGNIEKGIGISMAFKGALEGLSATWKLLNNVMRANPIGLIITAVALLIAGVTALIMNWDKLEKLFTSTGHKVKNLTDRLGENKEIILALLGPIGWLALAWEKVLELQEANMTTAEKNAAREERLRKAQGKAALKRHQKRVDQIKEEQELRKKSFDDEQEIFDMDIRRMEAEGKNANELKRAKIQANLDEKKAELETINELLESWTKYYTDLFEISGKSKEDFLAQMKGQGIDLVALQEQANERIEKANREIFEAETDMIEFEYSLRKEKVEKEVEDKESQKDKILRLEKEKQEELKRLQEKEQAEYEKFLQDKAKAEKDFLDSELSPHNLEIQKVHEKYDTLIEQAIQYGEDTKVLEEALQTELQAIRDRYAEEEAQKRKENNQALMDGAQELFTAANSLATALHEKDKKRAEEKLARGEKLSKEEVKRLKRQEKIQKAFALVQIGIDTAKAVAGAISQAQSVPYPANLAAIASGIAAVIAGSVQAYQILGESSDLPSAADVQTDSGSENTSVPEIQSSGFGSTLLNQRVYVVESDITGAQNNVEVIEAGATFG